MAPVKKSVRINRRGAVLIISMIFVLIFSALAVSMATMSGTNVQLASNQHKVDCAFASTESGQEAMRYWLSDVKIPSSTPHLTTSVQLSVPCNTTWMPITSLISQFTMTAQSHLLGCTPQADKTLRVKFLSTPMTLHSAGLHHGQKRSDYPHNKSSIRY